MIDSSKSIEACAAYYGDDADAMKSYLIEGEKKALNLDNRGPISFENDGSLASNIRQAYSKYGFYIFEGALSDEEVRDIKDDINLDAKEQWFLSAEVEDVESTHF